MLIIDVNLQFGKYNKLGRLVIAIDKKEVTMNIVNTESIVIESPVKGEWAIFNPPSHPKLAFDFLAVDENKSPYKIGGLLRHLFSFVSVEHTYTWSAPVNSPVAGKVIEVENSAKDRISLCMSFDLCRLLINKPKVEEGFSAFGGNYVVIECEDFYVLLCHMKEGSINVKAGDEVVIGKKLGEVGNSGSSIQPHLHVQVMKNKNIFPLFANLVPFRLANGQRRIGKEITEIKNFLLVNGDHYIFTD